MGVFTPTPELKVAALYVAALIVMGIVLTMLVVRQRVAKRINLGDGNNPVVLQAMRAHGNFAEQAPALIAVLLTLPLVGGSMMMVHLVGVLGLAGRVSHAAAMFSGARPGPLRVGGMVLTFAALLVGAFRVISLAI